MSDFTAPPQVYSSDEDMVEYLAEYMPEIREYYRIITSPETTLPAQLTISNSEKPHKGKHWSKEEHKLMLEGIKVFGRGKWKKIAKHYVKTRSSVQVAGHAQQFFRRFESNKNAAATTTTTTRKKRASIHDDMITADQVFFHSITS